MIDHRSASAQSLRRRFVPLATVFLAVAGIWTPVATPLAAQPTPTPRGATVHVAGIPDRPDLVTVVPFDLQHDTTSTFPPNKIILQAKVDGHVGSFLLDLGDPDLDLSRALLQPSPTGGVDTITDANRVPDDGGQHGVYVTLCIGTLKIVHLIAGISHQWNDYTIEGHAPRLGNIGLSALEPFETIIDYLHRRLVLIRLDAAGHRLVDVPAYPPRWSAPLLDIPPYWWGVRARIGGVEDSLFFDTGAMINALWWQTMGKVSSHIAAGGILDSIVIGGRAFSHIQLNYDNPPPRDVLGFPFLSSLGVVGFNHRTHQFLLYR